MMLRSIVVAGAAVVALAGCASPPASPPETPTIGESESGPVDSAPVDDSPLMVVYEVTGDASMVTYGANGNSSQETDPESPWRVQEPADGSFGFYSLSAQADQSGGEITCRIRVGDDVVAENTSSGPFAMTVCNGNA